LENLKNGVYSDTNLALYNEDFIKMANIFDEEAKGLNKTQVLINFLKQFNAEAL